MKFRELSFLDILDLIWFWITGVALLYVIGEFILQGDKKWLVYILGIIYLVKMINLLIVGVTRTGGKE